VGIDLGYEATEVLRRAMKVQCCTIGPGFDEDEVTRILLVCEELIAKAQWLSAGKVHKLSIERYNDTDCLGSNEILCNDLEHKAFPMKTAALTSASSQNKEFRERRNDA
jgi:hypothetical protein